MTAYREFLEGKFRFSPAVGFTVDPAESNPAIKPMTAEIARWMIAGGRRAFFGDFGLHKTNTQLEVHRLHGLHGAGLRLQVLPLDVTHEFTRDASTYFTGDYALKLKFIRSVDQIDDERTIYLTNYETVRDGKLDPNLFEVASLDEASVLRSYGSLTYQTFLTLFDQVRFKYVNTATPSPNRYKELIHYAGYLGVMDTGQALTRFFQRNSEQANDLTIYPHMKREFFAWLHSWALFLQKPSDLGYSDDGYDLPPLNVVYHEIPSAAPVGKFDRDGQAKLLADAGMSLPDQAAEKRETITVRVAKLQEIIATVPEEHLAIWSTLEDERFAIEDALPRVAYDRWLEFKDGHPDALALYERHCSAYHYADGRERKLFLGPGEKMVLLTRERDALFGWRKFKDDSGQSGVNCAVFRNEGDQLSSELIREATAIAWIRWPGERLYTFVDPDEIRSSNPGACFIKAGWRRCEEKTKGGLVILEALPGVDVPQVEPQMGCVSVYGSQDPGERAAALIGFAEGTYKYINTKPEIAGSGCNFQHFCHTSVFVGIDDRFNDFIQAIHRFQRFGQVHQVDVHVIHTEAERAIVERNRQKWKEHVELRAEMSAIIREHRLGATGLATELRRSVGCTRRVIRGSRYEIVNNDSVEEYATIESNRFGMGLTSVPFGNHYEYSASYNDFGHNPDHVGFFGQMDFLTPNVYRTLQPGRVLVVHVKDRIRFGNVTGDGFPTVEPFHSDCITHYRKHGFKYFGMITIVTDVVRENNQTYRLSWSEQCKDGTKMGVGSPEYLLLFRKPQTDRTKGYADVPVAKTKDEYPLERWQPDAHAFWRSSGNRLVTFEEVATAHPSSIGRLFEQYSLTHIYSHEEHVELGRRLEERGVLPRTFMAIPPASHHPDVWHDVIRFKTLNGEQSRRGLENHICPLQIDVVDRAITRWSNPGDEISDPFGGLMTVPARAVALGRRGHAVELKPEYFDDGARYPRAAEESLGTPTLFDVVDPELVEVR